MLSTPALPSLVQTYSQTQPLQLPPYYRPFEVNVKIYLSALGFFFFSAPEIPFMFPISAAYDPGSFQTNPMKEWNAAPSFTALGKTYSPAGNFAMVVHILPNSRHGLEMEFLGTNA